MKVHIITSIIRIQVMKILFHCYQHFLSLSGSAEMLLFPLSRKSAYATIIFSPCKILRSAFLHILIVYGWMRVMFDWCSFTSVSPISAACATAMTFIKVKSDSANKRLWMAPLVMLQTSLPRSISSNISP